MRPCGVLDTHDIVTVLLTVLSSVLSFSERECGIADDARRTAGLCQYQLYSALCSRGFSRHRIGAR
jgi:hypothetical protein